MLNKVNIHFDAFNNIFFIRETMQMFPTLFEAERAADKIALSVVIW